MNDLSVLQLWCIGMVAVIVVALLVSRKKPPQLDPWKQAVYNPKEFRTRRPRQ